MLSNQQERILILPTLIEREKNLEKVLELAAELAALLDLETKDRQQETISEKALPAGNVVTRR